MTPRLAILFLVAAFLVALFLVGEPLAEHDSQVTREEPHVWPTVQADPNPAYARLAFLTSLPRARSAPSKRTVMRAASVGGVNGHPCGPDFDLPPCYVMMRESRGDPNAYNPTGCGGRGCRGKWQCDPRTCSGTGTEEQQDAEARALWNHGAGCAHWGACG